MRLRSISVAKFSIELRNGSGKSDLHSPEWRIDHVPSALATAHGNERTGDVGVSPRGAVTRDLAKVTLDEAKADLEDRTVEAPFSGIVGLTDVEVGDRITATTAITTLDDRSKLFVDFRAPEAALTVLLNQPEVTLQPWTNRDKTLPAEIAEVAPRVMTLPTARLGRAVARAGRRLSGTWWRAVFLFAI